MGYVDAVLEAYLQGTPGNPDPPRVRAGLARWLFISVGEGDSCCLQAVADLLAALKALSFIHPTPKPAVTILLYWV